MQREERRADVGSRLSIVSKKLAFAYDAGRIVLILDQSCCQIYAIACNKYGTFLSAGVTSEGPIAVFRDRSASEVRDIYIVRQVNGSWTTPQVLQADNSNQRLSGEWTIDCG